MLDLDVVAQGRLVPVALMAVSDGAAEHSLDFGCLPAVVAFFLGEARDKELHAEHLFMFFHIFLYREKRQNGQFILFGSKRNATWHTYETKT